MVDLSRPKDADPRGKRICQLDTMVCEETEHAVIAMAALNGKTKSEMMRILLEDALFGRFPMLQRMAQSRMSNQESNSG